jgi:hypothetical protein
MRLTLTRYTRGVRTVGRRLAASDGVVLLWALLIMFVLLVTTAGAAELVTSNEAAFGRDNSSTSALDISEAGVAAAFAAIKAAPDTTTTLSGNGTLDHGTWSYTAGRTQSTTDSTRYTWTVDSTGVLGQSTHVVQDQLLQTVVPTSTSSTSTTTTPQSPAYGWGVFLGAGTSDCTSSSEAHPDSFAASAALSTSVYVAGSLCVSGGGSPVLQEPASSSGGTVSLYVGGKFQTKSNSSPIGTSSKLIKSATVVGGCLNVFKTNKPPVSVTCSTQGDPTSNKNASGIYAQTYSSTQSSLTKPTVDPNAYADAKPGPDYGCNSFGTSVSSYPSGWTATKFDHTVFDNDTTQNTSLSGAPSAGSGNIDLGQIVNNSGSGHAANSFDCRYYDASGNLIGELAFNYPASGSEGAGNPGILTIDGSVFIDGNLDFGTNDYIEYRGTGTIYVNGTVSVENGASICAVPISGSPCVGNFDSSQNLLELVALNAGSATYGWSMTGAGVFEGIAFTNGGFYGGNSSQINGNVIADYGTFNGAESLTDTFSVPANAPGAASTTTTTSTTGGPDQVTFAADPGSWEQLR